MRRGFLLSTPRESRKAAPPLNSADTRPSTSSGSQQSTKQESTSSLAASMSPKVIHIPARYTFPPPLPDYQPDLFPGDECTLEVTHVPPGVRSPELITAFGHSGSMLDALRAQYPGWPQPFTPPPPVYKIVPIEGTGLGMVATEDIAGGATIARERPIFLMPRVIPASPAERRRIDDSVVRMLHSENRRAFYALKNAQGNAAPSEVRGIMGTNSFEAGPFPTYPARYAGMARDMSRANHSCSPNATHSFDPATLTHVLRAFHSIRAGEEVTISYLSDTLLSYEARQEELSRGYHFKCGCKVCRLSGEARMVSAISRRVIRERTYPGPMREDEAAFEVWLSNAVRRNASARDPSKGMSLQLPEMDALVWASMEQEGCYEPGLWELVLERLVKASAVLENEDAVRHYAKKAAELRTAQSGSDGGWCAVAENSRQTEWWAKRSM